MNHRSRRKVARRRMLTHHPRACQEVDGKIPIQRHLNGSSSMMCHRDIRQTAAFSAAVAMGIDVCLCGTRKMVRCGARARATKNRRKTLPERRKNDALLDLSVGCCDEFSRVRGWAGASAVSAGRFQRPRYELGQSLPAVARPVAFHQRRKFLGRKRQSRNGHRRHRQGRCAGSWGKAGRFSPRRSVASHSRSSRATEITGTIRSSSRRARA